jgi:ATP-dependent RNA helicase DeaD
MSENLNPFLREPDRPLPETSLEKLPERLQKAVAKAGWKSLMPVQARIIPYFLEGRDAVVQARTGSGKTGAFLLPMLERLDPGLDACQALILAPTRELAKQVCQDADTLCSDAGFRHVPVYGGVGYGPQIDAFRKGAHIVVGTPGRLIDHMDRGTLVLDELRMLIFDEADRMLSMGFFPDIQRIQSFLPGRTLHAGMFSATFPAFVLHLANEFMSRPVYISLSTDHVHVTDTQHVFYRVPDMEKDRGLIRILETENPEAALIFCNTKSKVHYVTKVLQGFGYDADELTSDLSQAERERVLGRVRDETLRFLVATDVASRGLDIPHLSHVILYEPPQDAEDYIHRAGRTGRAGAAGTAISIVGIMETFDFKKIGLRYDIEMEERSLPTDEEVASLVSQRVMALLEARLRDRPNLQKERSQRFASLGRALSETEDELAIITMLLDDYYQKSLHAPPPRPEGEKMAPKPDRDRRKPPRKKGGGRRSGGRRRRGGGRGAR